MLDLLEDRRWPAIHVAPQAFYFLAHKLKLFSKQSNQLILECFDGIGGELGGIGNWNTAAGYWVKRHHTLLAPSPCSCLFRDRGPVQFCSIADPGIFVKKLNISMGFGGFALEDFTLMDEGVVLGEIVEVATFVVGNFLVNEEFHLSSSCPRW